MREILIAIFALITATGYSQLAGNQSRDLFAAENFAFGIRGGVNATGVIVKQSFAVFSTLPGQEELTEKTYEKMSENRALEFGLVLQYKLGERVKFNFNPGFTNYNYAFTNTYNWQSASGSLNAEYIHNYKTRYLNLPFVLSFHFLNGNIQPYAGGGMYLNYRRDAFLRTEYNLTDAGVDTSNNIFMEDTEIATPETFLDKYYGAIANLGVTYLLGGIEVAFELQYNSSLLNPVSAKNRYEEQQIIGQTYTLPDDVLLQHTAAQLVFTIPVVCEARNGYRN